MAGMGAVIERFMAERDEALTERDAARKRVKRLTADVERGRDIVQDVRQSNGELTVVLAAYCWARGEDELSVDLSKEGGG